MAKETMFLEFLGSSLKTKMLELLVVGRDLEYTLNDIVRGSRVNRKRAYYLLNEMIKHKTIVRSKTVKNLRFYRLNTKKAEVKTLIRLFDQLTAKYS